jgi:rhodanese-related sulfurtransferase
LTARISPAELAAWRADPARVAPLIVDVREPWEIQKCAIEGSQAMPLRELPARVADLPDDRDLVLVCHHGSRSEQAAAWLARQGFDRVHNLEGGIDAWARTVDPAMPRY